MKLNLEEEIEKCSHIYSHSYDGVVSVEFCKSLYSQMNEAKLLLKDVKSFNNEELLEKIKNFLNN
jgi:hypothetical protein